MLIGQTLRVYSLEKLCSTYADVNGRLHGVIEEQIRRSREFRESVYKDTPDIVEYLDAQLEQWRKNQGG
jgi:hypothetical protein